MTDRITAMRERGHFILTVWPDKARASFGAPAVRAATSSLSNGETIEVSDAQGRTLPYWPALPGGLKITANFALGSRSQSVTLITSLLSGINPRDLGWQNGKAWAEIAWINETSGGTAVDAWEDRELDKGISGWVRGFSWGAREEQITFSIDEEEISDRGSFHAPGAEITDQRHADVTDGVQGTDDRARAYRSYNILPPIVIQGPTDFGMLAPLPVWADEVDAASGTATNLTGRRHGVSYEPIADTSTTRQCYVEDPQESGRFVNPGSGEYLAAVSTDTDDLGDTYWYIDGGENFLKALGTAGSWDIDTGVDAQLITTTRASSSHNAQAGDQVRMVSSGGTPDGDDDWVTIATHNEAGVGLDSAYAHSHTGGSAGSAEVIKLVSDVTYPAWWRPGAAGGIEGPKGDAMYNPMDVIVWALQRADLNVRIHWGDFQSLRALFDDWSIAHVIMDRGQPLAAPFQWILQKFEPILPVRFYLEGGALRCKWTGPMSVHDVVTEIDLDEDTGAFRRSLIRTTNIPAYDTTRLYYGYDVRTNKHRRSMTIGPDVTDQQTSNHDSGRAAVISRLYKSEELCRTVGEWRGYVDITWDDHTAQLICHNQMYFNTRQRWLLTLERMAPHYRFLKRGDLIKCTQSGVTYDTMYWQIENLTQHADGAVRVDAVTATV